MRQLLCRKKSGVNPHFIFAV